jgi:hypothetical protein
VEPEFSLTIAIIPAALIHVALAVYFVRIETRIGMLLVLVSLLLITVYIWTNCVYKGGHAAEIVYLVSRILVLNGDSFLAKTPLKDEMLFFAGVALGFSSIAFTTGSICFANFGKGLKPLVLGQIQRKRPNNEFETDYQFQRLNHNVVAEPEQARRFALD